MKKQCISIVLIALLIAGCATAPAIYTAKPPDSSEDLRRNLLLGRWYGEAKTREGGKRLQIIDRNVDGTFKVQFRVIEGSGKVWDQTEVGLWGISGPVYFTITRGWIDGQRFLPANPTQATFYDAYEILELSKDKLCYKSFAIGDEYTVKRVSDSFSFPE
jgi:hypothetical protein